MKTACCPSLDSIGSSRYATIATSVLVSLATLVLGVSDAAAIQPPSTAIARYVSMSGNDAGTCTRAQPCRSLNRAYAVATPGTVVRVAAGAYPLQQIRTVADRHGPPVIIQPAPHAAVELQGLQLGDAEIGNGPSYLEVRGLAIPGGSVEVLERSRDVTLRDLRAANFYIRGAQRIQIVGGSYGPCLTDGVTAHCGNNKIDVGASPWRTSDIVVQGVLFHDYRVVPGSGAHFECLFIRGGDRVAVKDSRFVNCEFFDLFVQWSGVPLDELRVTGNHFEGAFDGAGNRRSITFMLSGGGYTWTNVTIAHNTFQDSELIMDDGTHAGFSNVVVSNNIFDGRLFCFPGVSYRANVTAQSACDPSDRTRVFGYRLQAGRLIPEPAEAAAVRAVFREIAAGKRAGSVARARRATHAPSPAQGWSAASVLAIVGDPIYLGSHVGGADAGEALVPPSDWALAQWALLY